MTPIIKTALVNALATAIYVIAIASFLFYVPKFFVPGRSGTVLVPAVMLLLLVFSAVIIGSIVFGRPAPWYLEGKKEESLSLVFYTLAAIFGITAVLIKNAITSAFAVSLYVIAVSSIMSYMPRFFGPGKADVVLMLAVMFLLLVFSAAVTGSLIFGRPVIWYLEGKKQEALSLLFYTIAFLFGITMILLVFAYLIP